MKSFGLVGSIIPVSLAIAYAFRDLWRWQRSRDRSVIASLIRKGWSLKKFKDFISSALPIGSTKESIKTFVEMELHLGYLELFVVNPHEGQMILAGELLAVDVVNTTGANEIISCGFGDLKTITGPVTVAFWIKDGKLSEISVRDKGEII